MWQRDRLDRDLDEELRSHIEMRAADNLAAGMSPEEARYEAQKRFGNTALLKEDTRRADIVGWMDVAARDFRYALRMLGRSPGFTDRKSTRLNSSHVEISYAVFCLKKKKKTKKRYCNRRYKKKGQRKP